MLPLRVGYQHNDKQPDNGERRRYHPGYSLKYHFHLLFLVFVVDFCAVLWLNQRRERSGAQATGVGVQFPDSLSIFLPLFFICFELG